MKRFGQEAALLLLLFVAVSAWRAHPRAPIPQQRQLVLDDLDARAELESVHRMGVIR